HSLAVQQHLLHIGVGRGPPAGQLIPVKEAVQVRRLFFEAQIVLLVAMRAADFIELLPFCLLWRECGFRVTACYAECRSTQERRRHRETNPLHIFYCRSLPIRARMLGVWSFLR